MKYAAKSKNRFITGRTVSLSEKHENPGFEEEGTALIDDAAETGFRVVQKYLKTLDNSPGVYRMLDTKGEVLYVGKATKPQETGVELRAVDRTHGADWPDDFRHCANDVSDH